MSEIKNIGKHTFIYGVGMVLSKLASFIMLPIYTHYLTPADYGVMELLATTIDVIGTVAGIGLANSVVKFHAEYNDPQEKREVLSTASMATVGIAMLVALGGFAFSSGLSELILKDAGRPLYFQVFFLIYLLTTAEALPLLYLRIRNRSRLFVALSLAKLIGMLSLNILFVVYLRMGVLGVLYSSLIVTGLSGLTLSTFMLRQTGLHFSLTKLKAMASFSYPLMFVYLGNFMLVFSDRYFLSQYGDIAQVGIYSLAYKFAFLLSALAFTPFGMVWGPQRFEIARRADAREIFSRVFVYLNIVVGGIGMGLALFVEDFIEVMSAPAYHPAHRLVAILLAAQVMHHWTAYANMGLLLKNRTGLFARASYIGVAAVIGLNFLLIPPWGMYGAAAATLLAYGVRFTAVNIAAQRIYPIDYRWATIAKMYAIFGAAVGLRAILPPSPLPASLAESTALALLAGCAVYFMVLSPDERLIIQSRIGHMRKMLAVRASSA